MKYKITFDNNLCEQNRVCEAEFDEYWVFDSAKNEMNLKGSQETAPDSNVFELIVDLDEDAAKKMNNAVVGCPKAAIRMDELA